MAIDDSMQSRITTDCPDATREILLHAWSHDTSALKKLLQEPGHASCQDPTTGETPLHAAIRACGPAPAATTENDNDNDDGDNGEDLQVEEAKETVHELFLSGAIWNDVDNNNETPGCLALRLGQTSLYKLCVEAGVRAEMLFGLLDGYEALSSGGSEMDEDEDQYEAVEVTDSTDAVIEDVEDTEEAPELVEAPAEQKRFQPPTVEDPSLNSEEYLRSNLTYSDGKLVDDGGNGVMMAWETDIMRKSVDALIPPNPASVSATSGKRILNIGFGMGIIDTMFRSTSPSRHHIIEAHPEVLSHIDANPSDASKFGAAWEASGPEQGAYKIHRGRWQDVVPKLLEAGEVYDAIYFDTFGEDYGQLKMFFTEFIPGLLDFEGRFSFFNGLGADRRICYDVYIKVVEMHMADAGLDVEWDEMDVDMKGLEKAGAGEWEGVVRRYWTLDKYRLPTCTFMG
ncbi:arginine N-methyltransferase 2 [Colletotrichum orchidophilum]|uniref:Arginine N-methyltransferase 2 n=1 Tax=Colletotrichum orchidophilum TaxID=1209926 RepID=A0A1G4B2Y0_9PEZI|nr:arginine N-methyltransferase 2 [Colletotrichum orchidophilum]OHE95779.1 arginine N-methyltransferase 2 [Colletotrichum orchidophilum]